MPILTRSASYTSSSKPCNKSHLTPHTPPPTHPRALIDMTPLPSLFDKMIAAAKRGKRSNSVQLKSKVGDDSLAFSPIPERPKRHSSDSVGIRDVQKPSDAPIEVEGEPETVAHQPPATSDHMDFEDTPIIFSEPLDPTPPLAFGVPPPVLAPALSFIHEEVLAKFPPPNPPYTYPKP